MERSVKYVVAGHVARTRANYATKNCGQLRYNNKQTKQRDWGGIFFIRLYYYRCCYWLPNVNKSFFQFLHVVCYFSVKSIRCFSFISVGLYGWGVIF